MTMSASPPIDIKDTQLQLQVQEAQARSRKLQMPQGPVAPRPVDKDKKLREACEGFESIFIQKMWEQMRATVPKTGFLHGREEQFWQGMFDQELAKKMSSAGGIGLADMMYDQLSRTLVSSSRTTASATAGRMQAEGQGSGFTVQAAPLMPPVQKPDNIAGDAKKEHAQYTGMYTGTAPHDGKSPAGHTGTIPHSNDAVANVGYTGAGIAGADAPQIGHTETGDSDEQAVQQALATLRQRQAEPPLTVVNTTHVSGTSRAQAARHTASTRLTGNAVLPPHTNAPQPSISQTGVAGTQAQAIAPHAPHAPHAPLPPQFVMQADTATPVRPDMISGVTEADSAVNQPAQAGQENPGLVNTTFTTNVPPKRNNTQKRPPRVPGGQPLIRTLGGAPASPVAGQNTPTQWPVATPTAPENMTQSG